MSYILPEGQTRAQLFDTIGALSESATNIILKRAPTESLPDDLVLCALAYQKPDSQEIIERRTRQLREGLPVDDKSISGFIARLEVGFYLLGADTEHCLWTEVDQVKSELEDEIAEQFGQVEGLALNRLNFDGVYLNTNVAADEKMTLVNIAPTWVQSLVRTQVDTTGEVDERGTLRHYLGGFSRETAFIEQVNSRLEMVSGYVAGLLKE